MNSFLAKYDIIFCDDMGRNTLEGKLGSGTALLSVACILLLTMVGCRSSYQVSSNAAGAEEAIVEIDLPPYQPASPRFFDILHTRLELEFDWENKWLIGQADITLKPYFYPQNQLMLDAKSFEIIGCDLVQNSAALPLDFQYDGEAIYINLEKDYKRSDTLSIRMKYIAKPYERAAQTGQAVTSDRGLFFINPSGADTLKPKQLWTQGETQFNSRWFPTIDAPNERFTQEIFLTVDSSLTTLSNGVLQSSDYLGNGLKKDHWKLDKPHAPYLAMIAVGNFAKVDDWADSLQLSYYVEPAFEKYAKDIFGNTPEMIAYFSQVLDYPYPWAKYDQIVVRDYVSGAMENTTASVFMEDLQVSRRELLDDHWDGIIAHELFHQWFGDLVTCESWANLALNEGFANYSEYLWNEHKYGKEEADYNLWIEKDNYLAEVADGKVDPVINYFYENPDDLFDSHRYSKAGLVLHMLRNYTGDEAFFASLNHYLKANAYQSVEIDDLRKSFEAVTGEDLQWFFEQWFELPGHPVLEVLTSYANDSLTININQLQVSDSIGLFVFPLDIQIWQGATSTTHELLVDAPEITMTLPLSKEPTLVEVDPERVLLAEIYQPKTSQELLMTFSNGSSFALRREALETLFSEGDSITIGKAAMLGLVDASPRLREMTLDNLVGRGHLTNPAIAMAVQKLTTDSRSLVRAAAFSAYSETQSGDIDEVMMKALADSSYSVIGAGLEVILQDYVEDPIWLRDFLRLTHLNIAAPIAGYYNQQVKEGHLDWYNKNLLSFHGMDRWMFLQYYIEYVVLTDLFKDESTAKVLTYIATNDNEYYNRIAAFQSMTLVIPETPENRKILASIAAKEEDQRAKAVMNSLLASEGN
jgi:aminopeptidase N